MARRPSFQFYPADWKGNAKLRRCAEAARGAWMDILCILHDSDEYGVCRWPLEDLARSAGVVLKLARELADKDVLKGADSGFSGYRHTPSHAGKEGEPVTLVAPSDGPVWFSSRMVRDEWLRSVRGASTRFAADKKSGEQPSRSPTRRHGDKSGDGPSTSSSSTDTSSLRSDVEREVVSKPALPDWLPEQPWRDFLDMRKKAHSAVTPRGQALLLAKLHKLIDAGNDPAEVLNQSTMNGWKGLFEIKRDQKNGSHRTNRSSGTSTTERAIAVLADIAGIDTGRTDGPLDGERAAPNGPPRLAIVDQQRAPESTADRFAGADQRPTGEADTALLATGHDGRADAFEIPGFLLRSRGRD